MDIEKLIEDLQWWAEHCDRTNYGCETRTILSDAATAISTLQIENQTLRNSANGFKAENEKLLETVDKYATAARVIALHLKPFCDESLPYDEMIADASRKASDELEQVKAERDAYKIYFEDLSSKPDCNTCENRNCEYRPKIGAIVRVNCPLYSGPQKED